MKDDITVACPPQSNHDCVTSLAVDSKNIILFTGDIEGELVTMTIIMAKKSCGCVVAQGSCLYGELKPTAGVQGQVSPLNVW